MPEERQKISITTGTMVRFVLVLLGVLFAYMFRDLIGALLVSVLLAFAMNPIADAFEKTRIPRTITVLVIYIVFFSLMGLLAYLLVPLLISEWSGFVHGFSAIWTKALSGFYSLQSVSARYGFEASFDQSVNALSASFSTWFGSLFSTISSVIAGIVWIFLVFVVSFFMVIERNGIRDLVVAITPSRFHGTILEMAGKMQKKVGQWLLGQLILMLTIGVITYIVLAVLGVKYALILAVFAGALEIIPYIGPIVATIPAVIFAAADSPTKALLVIVLYFLVQRLENVVLVPKVMQKTTGLNPIVAILSLAVGYTLGGIFGALLAIPVATAGNVVLNDYLGKNNR